MSDSVAGAPISSSASAAEDKSDRRRLSFTSAHTDTTNKPLKTPGSTSDPHNRKISYSQTPLGKIASSMTGVIDIVRNAISPERHHDAAGKEPEKNERGRLHVVGRGGLGNETSSSGLGDVADEDRAKSRSRSRGRPNHVYSSGIGGLGNARSPSRRSAVQEAQEAEETKLEREVQKKFAQEETHHTHSSGIGGLGNAFHPHKEETK